MSGNRSIRIDGVTLTTGNTKMGRVLNISLPPVLTCDHNLPCYQKGCYAMRSAYNMYPEVRNAWDGNYAVWKASWSMYGNAVRKAVAKIRPTLSWIPRMIGRGKIRAAASRAPLAPRRTNVAPISSEPAAITSTPKPSEMAMAPKALSGCTGMGSR